MDLGCHLLPATPRASHLPKESGILDQYLEYERYGVHRINMGKVDFKIPGFLLMALPIRRALRMTEIVHPNPQGQGANIDHQPDVRQVGG